MSSSTLPRARLKSHAKITDDPTVAQAVKTAVDINPQPPLYVTGRQNDATGRFPGSGTIIASPAEVDYAPVAGE